MIGSSPRPGLRTRIRGVLGLVAVVVLGAACGGPADHAPELSPSEARIAAGSVTWVQYAAGGPQLRVVAAVNHCPDVVVDGTSVASTERELVDPDFPAAACSVPVAPGDVVEYGPHRREVPRRVDRIVVLADPACEATACEVESFAELAKAAAATHPDLVVIAGDLVADSEVCFERPGCRPPWDDRWATWKLRFFDPAAPLLAAAPVVFARGAAHGCRGHMYEGWGHLVAAGAYPAGVECRSADPAVSVDLDRATRLVATDVATGSPPPRRPADARATWVVAGVERPVPTAGDGPSRATPVIRPSAAPGYVTDRGDGVAELRVGSATGTDASFWLLERRDGCWKAELRRIRRADHDASVCLRP